MRKYLIIGLLIIVMFISIIIPINWSQSTKGILAYNVDKTMIFFVPLENLDINVCGGDLAKNKALEGFQFRQTLDNYTQFIESDCWVVTSFPGKDYGPPLRIWNFSKCNADFSFNESIVSKLLSIWNYKTFSCEVDNKLFLKFRYVYRHDTFNMKLRKISR